jgi:o-succinylbenzoate---CoA ligase
VNTLQLNAARHPDRVALSDGNRRWTWAQLLADAQSIAGFLRDEQSIRPGDIVATCMGNSARHVLLLHAVWLCGAAAAPLNTRLAAPERLRQLSFLAPRLLISESESGNSVIPTLHPDTLPDTLRDTHPDTLRDGSIGADITETAESDAALCSILFTSGTAGTVKAVPHSWRNHRASAEGSAENLGVRYDDNWLCVIPLFHIGGLAIVTRCLFYGTAMTVQQGFDAAEMIAVLRRERITLLSVVPTMLQRLLDTAEDFSAAGLPALRAILLGGAGAAKGLWETVHARDLPVLGTYGLTESCSQVVTASPSELRHMAGSAGRPIPGAELKICDSSGTELLPGVDGEIRLRGSMLTDGYLRNDMLNAHAFEFGWFRTGDTGHVDKHGLLHVLGRCDDMIVTGGENVFPSEIEDVLLRHPSIREAAVAGIADAEWGMKIAVMVVADEDADVDALEAWCRERLAGYKCPRVWMLVAELPKTASGKVMRAEVREALGRGGERT